MAISFNLDRKLIFLVMTVSVVGLSITGYFSYNYAEDIIQERIGDQLRGESTTRGEAVRLLFEAREDQNNVIANDPMIRLLVDEMNAAPRAELGEYREKNRGDFLVQIQAFQELIGHSIGFEDVKVIGSGGDVFFSLVKAGDSFAGDPLFVRGLAGSFIDFEPSAAGKKMVAVTPIPGDGADPAGVIISKMRTAALDGILTNRGGLGETGEVYMVNRDGLMLSESRSVEGSIFQTKVETLAVLKCLDEGSGHLGFYAGYDGGQIYGSSYCADDLGIVVLAEMGREEVEGPTNVFRDRILQTAVAITVGMGAVAYVMSKSLSRPLIKLQKAAHNIAGGDFGVRTDIRTRDEIGDLSRAFDTMAQKLRDSLVEIREKEDVIQQQEEILLKFSQHVQNDCVGVIDMKDSTKISAELSEEEFSKLYETFLNFMARIIRSHDGEVIKSIGDALMFRFPNIKEGDSAAMQNVMECCLAMLEAHDRLRDELKEKGLPGLDYKISATYGSVKVADSSTSHMSDIFGPTVNRCFKINSLCPKNRLVVGINLYETLKGSGKYAFERLPVTELKEKYGYEIFKVVRA